LAHFDLIVIGGGSGGVACARRAASYGAKVALCEDSRVGGTCVIRGCIPKKLMRYGAVFAEHFRSARSYGWRLAEPELDWGALIDARNREIARLNGIYLEIKYVNLGGIE
jgi:glutathione reductase (NADPH)